MDKTDLITAAVNKMMKRVRKASKSELTVAETITDSLAHHLNCFLILAAITFGWDREKFIVSLDAFLTFFRKISIEGFDKMKAEEKAGNLKG